MAIILGGGDGAEGNNVRFRGKECRIGGGRGPHAGTRWSLWRGRYRSMQSLVTSSDQLWVQPLDTFRKWRFFLAPIPHTIAPCIGGNSPSSGFSSWLLIRLPHARRQRGYGLEPLVTSCHFWQGSCVVTIPARNQAFRQPGQAHWLVAPVLPRAP